MRVLQFMLLLLLLMPRIGSAVLVTSEPGTASAPPDDPGWAHLGTRTGTNPAGQAANGLTLIYMGHGWVLTAKHVGEADLLLGGQIYPRVPGSASTFTSDNGQQPDLLAFRVSGNPELPNLPALEIRDVSMAIGDDVVMIGRGQNRGAATQWFGPDLAMHYGWLWAPGAAMRWGTNRVTDLEMDPADTTHSIVFDFTEPGEPEATANEGQAVLGDSGGAIFTKSGSTWELAGVLFSAAQFEGQNPASSLDGNLSLAADLSYYRSQILPIVRPECSDEVDNNANGLIDYPADWGCPSPSDDSEGGTELPGLSSMGGASLVFFIGAWSVAWLCRQNPAPKGRLRDSPRHSG